MNPWQADSVWQVSLAAVPSALGCAQREIWQLVIAWRLQPVADVVELLTLELVSTAIGPDKLFDTSPAVGRLQNVHPLWLRFQRTADRLVIALVDSDPRPPPLRSAGTGNSSAGTLYWVPMLADAWDYFDVSHGKVVWCEISIPAAYDRRLPQRRVVVRQTTPRRLPHHIDAALLDRILGGLRQISWPAFVRLPPSANWLQSVTDS
jgi:hypothetical protein